VSKFLENKIVFIYTIFETRFFGSLIDTLEYYQFFRERSDEVYLLFVTNLPKDKLFHFVKNIVDNKYTRFQFDHVVFESIFEFQIRLARQFKYLITLEYTTLENFKHMLNAKNIIIVSENTSQKYFLKRPNVTYYTEMPFCYKDIDYKIKLYFDIYKKIDNFKDKLYVNYPKGNIEEVIDIAKKYSNDKEILDKESNHNANIHEEFSEYLYIKSPYWFDTHPRLFLECEYYHKPYYYVNELNIKDGSWYRYYEIKERGIQDHILDENDEIFRTIIS
jgi:hypothetical protein